MKSELKKLERGQVELTVEIGVEEFQPFLDTAVKKISESVKIPGFRPGKAGYDLIKNKVGETEIWQEALEPAVRKTFTQALNEQKINSIGSPKIDIIKLAPSNPVIYKATVALLPAVELADYSKIKIERKPVTIKPEQIKKTLENFQKMHAKETTVKRPAKVGDKVDIGFETFLDKIPVDHGKNEKFSLVIGEGNFIPGFEEQLTGLNEGDTKEFQLKFPENYHQKNLAGKLADFKVKMNGVYARELPALDDEFAKSLGEFKSLKEIEEKVAENLRTEAEAHEDARLEDEMFEKIISQSKFDDIPDLLVNSEAQKMMEEMEYGLQQQGLKFEDYLTHLKKNREQLLLEFAPQAIKRVKSALIIRKVGTQEKVTVTDEEIESELHKTIHSYGHDPEVEKNLNTPAYRDYLRNVLTSKKVINHLKKSMTK